ncbi:MAG TPA: HRDC domain-containing protein [Planctomycetota bacterium]|nr:HRDC domain-containing protein [Planctomycetota bacterium]
MTTQADDAPLLVETQGDLARLAERLAREPRVALDTEADSLHAFRERVCVVQVSVPGLDAIVDPLKVPDLSPLREVVARPDVEIVFHGGDYDITVLSRDHGFSFGRVFDTMIAATLLGVEKVGLQALVEAEWGVLLSKKFQTSDWKRRPFSPAQVEYLRSDTRYLLELRERLTARLAAADLEEEAAIEFRRLATRRGAPHGDDPEAWRRVRGADRLDARGRAVFARAFAWRDEVAARHDVPRFRVVTNDALVALATNPPADLAALGKVPGTEGTVRAGDGEALLAALLAGVDDAARGEGPAALERPRLTSEERSRRDAARGREERLRAWRTHEARRRQVPNVVVLPNPALLAFAEDPPLDVAAVAAHPDCGRKRAALYGTAILEALAGPAPK